MGSIGKSASAWLLLALSGCATTAPDGHAKHSLMSGGTQTQALEQGQAAFAAIAELVLILQADANTDWSKVSIDALREHLVDMQQVTMDSVVQREKTNAGYRFDVSGEGRVVEAIQRMVPTHAQVIADSLNWRINTQLTDSGVLLEMEADSELEQQKIAALGFYGFMAIGAHHQAHHQAMARGDTLHMH